MNGSRGIFRGTYQFDWHIRGLIHSQLLLIVDGPYIPLGCLTRHSSAVQGSHVRVHAPISLLITVDCDHETDLTSVAHRKKSANTSVPMFGFFNS